ncbi:MAG TPA: hypothetical protein P5248_00825, partial [Bacteroidales bacterium]|nr:hypothetical protein [Bacteroidales bacterium]
MEELDALRKQWKLQDMEGDLPGLPGRDEVAWGSGFLRVLRTEVRLNIILSILLGAALAIGHSTPFLGGLMTLFLLSLLSLAFYYRMQRTVLSLADPTAEVMTHVGQLRKG